MTEKRKEERFLIYVPKGKESEFRLYKKVLHEMGLTVNDRIFKMINDDMQIIISVVSTIKEKGDKENE